MRQETDLTEPVPARYVSIESLFSRQPDAQHPTRNGHLSRWSGRGPNSGGPKQKLALRAGHAQGLLASGFFHR